MDENLKLYRYTTTRTKVNFSLYKLYPEVEYNILKLANIEHLNQYTSIN